MPTLLQLFTISISLAADSFSVSIAGGMKSHKTTIPHALKVGAFMGLFQALMPLIGWTLGELLKNFISAIDHWVAFVLLAFIGIKMIREALNSNHQKRKNILDTKTLILLSLATSIDALIMGITLKLLQVPLLVSISVIGLVTFTLCFLGFLFGKKLGEVFGKRIEIIGGLVLITLGIKILIEHLLK